jgi:serine/threonine-protein kinase
VVDPERWKKIDEIFAGAADLPDDERAAFVGVECADDASLRDEVMKLLDADRGAKAALHGIVDVAEAPVEPIRAPRSRSVVVNIAVCVLVVVTLVVIGSFIRARVSHHGPTLSTWTLHVDGTQRGAVVLPQNLFEHMLFRVVDYSLETAIDKHAGPLTLNINCFHAPLALDVDGVRVADLGDAGGTHQFVIPAAADRQQLVLRARHDMQSMAGFGVAPYVTQGPATRSVVGTINRWVATVGLVMAALFTVLFGMMFALDRRRREYLAWVISTLGSTGMLLYMLGVLPNATLPARHEPFLVTLFVAVTIMPFDYILRQSLGMPRHSRVWRLVISLTVVCGAAVSIVPQAGLVLALATTAYPAFFIYAIVTCIRRGRGEYAADARILLAWATTALVLSIVETYWRFTQTNLLGGVHGPAFNVLIVTIAQIAIIARQDTARRRTLEHTAEELRRQIAQRSKDLAETLAKLASDHDMLAVGRVLDGRYRIVRTLGAGGMGTVYEGVRVSDAKRVALKTLRGNFDAKHMARLAREGQLAADVDHPNIVPVIDIAIADGLLFLVMDLIDGRGLDDEKARFGDPRWATPILAQIARGLAALHARGIIHRDLKPSNILFAAGVARISDFGISTLDTDQAGALATTPQLTRHGDVFGTPMYMAPELAEGSQRAAPSSDVFSFGVLAHELLAGHSPFAEPPLLARISKRPLPEPTLEVIGELRAVIARCLDIEPTKRPTAAELVTAFL